MVYKGRQAYKQTGDGTSGGYYTTTSAFTMYFPQDRQPVAFQEDALCYRVTAIVAYDLGIGSGDVGLEVGASNNYNIITASAPGFQMAPVSATHFGVRVRQNGGGPLTVDKVIPIVVDIREWNMLEFRFLGATVFNPAAFKAFLNGVPVASYAWGPGTLLPAWANGTVTGYSIAVGNRGAVATYIASCGLAVASASTEAGLL
jgi:hypothetical protein